MHATGHPLVLDDQEQQYEVSYWSTADGKRKVFGRAETPEGVQAMMNSIRLNPGMSHPRSRDRIKHPDPLPPTPPKIEGEAPKKRSYDEPDDV